jgi:hypothetical protein
MVLLAAVQKLPGPAGLIVLPGCLLAAVQGLVRQQVCLLVSAGLCPDGCPLVLQQQQQQPLAPQLPLALWLLPLPLLWQQRLCCPSVLQWPAAAMPSQHLQ